MPNICFEFLQQFTLEDCGERGGWYIIIIPALEAKDDSQKFLLLLLSLAPLLLTCHTGFRLISKTVGNSLVRDPFFGFL